MAAVVNGQSKAILDLLKGAADLPKITMAARPYVLMIVMCLLYICIHVRVLACMYLYVYLYKYIYDIINTCNRC